MEVLILLAAVSLLLVLERVPHLRFLPLPVARPYAGTDLVYLLTSGIALSFAARGLGGQFLAPATSFTFSAALVVCTFVLYDFGAYVSHRLLHRIDALWELHKVHHSSRELDWLATFRGHILEHVIRQALSPLFLIAAGVPIAVVGVTGAAHAAWAAFGHSNFRPRIRFLDWLLITPRLHRAHHVAAACERNFGTVLSVWDRLAGTLQTDTEASAGPLGVPAEIETYPQTWSVQLVEPLRRWRRQPTAYGGFTRELESSVDVPKVVR